MTPSNNQINHIKQKRNSQINQWLELIVDNLYKLDKYEDLSKEEYISELNRQYRLLLIVKNTLEGKSKIDGMRR